MRELLIAQFFVLLLIHGAILRGLGFDSWESSRFQDWALLGMSLVWFLIGAWKSTKS